MNHLVFVVAAGMSAMGAPGREAGSPADGLLPFDSRWDHPHYLSWRPANGAAAEINPPRFSWPAAPEIVAGRDGHPLREYVLQLALESDFARPDHEFHSHYNFFNALPALAPGRWRWRVLYLDGDRAIHVSAVRSFEVARDAPVWDRTVIDRAAAQLAALPRPRLGPPAGDWAAWRTKLEADAETARWLSDLGSGARKLVRNAWWKSFPATDLKGDTEFDEQDFADAALGLTRALLAWKLTGDAALAPARNHLLTIARYPKGGLSSPEFHGQGSTKWPTQITECLALAYDWLHDDLSPDDREALLKSVEWRLRAVYLEKSSWRRGRNLSPSGVSVFCASHPYENFMWSLSSVLLTTGDLALSDELAPMVLNYLAGVGSAHGPDEGWNEGLSYGSGKGRAYLEATLAAALLLPELNPGRNPMLPRLGEWYAHLLPLGIPRLSFGDYAAAPMRAAGPQLAGFRYLARMTGDGRCETRRRALEHETGGRLSPRPWLDLAAAVRLPYPESAPEAAAAVFPEAGWVMASSRTPSDRDGFADATGMIFQCRPRGGFSHSYRAENSFVWHAFGQSLSAGGGGTAYPDPHSRHSLSHNVVLIRGVGQEWDSRTPARPLCGRLLAWRQGPDHVYWAGDATHAYQTVPDLVRWHRHVVFVDNRWFVLFDDLALTPDADPATFSWLYHVAPKVPVEIDPTGAGFRYTMENVHARVLFAKKGGELQIDNLRGRDGFRNPLTGADLYDATVKAVGAKDRPLRDDQIMENNLWVNNRRPARQWALMTVLLAHRDGEPEPAVGFDGETAVRVACPGSPARTVSFDPRRRADIVVDLPATRLHAQRTDPVRVTADGTPETVEIGGDSHTVRWMTRETFDRDDWVNRWAVEGDCAVEARDGRLLVRRTRVDPVQAATIWFRPELPRDVFIRFRASAIEPVEKNAANLNLILHAREADGTPLRFGRSGAYKEYHEIPNYIVTLVGGHRDGWSRARRNPGFHQLNEVEIRAEVGRAYEIAVALQGGRLRYYVDGRRIHDVADPDPLPGGWFGLRTWSTDGWWEHVEFGELLSGPHAPAAGAD